ncbi:WD40 repeatcontaining protein [Botrytis cinerea]
MFPGKESRHQSAWEEEALLELLFRAPNLVTNDDLLNISLSNLAKNVNDELSASFIMKIYCRWLEVHRRSPLQLFKAWPNTIKQWVESLEHRGVDKEIVIAHVVDWKKDNGPSTINGAKGWIEEKHLPSVGEIERVFDEKHSLNEDKPSDKGCFDRGEYRSDRPSSKSDLGGARSEYVPSSYICNRCGKNGHLVKQCPTNMDPAFDMKPPESYKCSICNKSGKHWYSLCPENIREDSITQKRLVARMKARTEKRTLDKRDGHKAKREGTSTSIYSKIKGAERDSRHWRVRKLDTFEKSGSSKREQAMALDHGSEREPELSALNMLEQLADIEERIHRASMAMAEDTGMTMEVVAEVTGVSISNVASTIMAANRKRARSMEMSDIGFKERQRTIRQKVECDDREELMHCVDDTRSLHLDVERHNADARGIFKETDPYSAEFELSQNLPARNSTNSTQDSMQSPQSDLNMRPQEVSPMDTSSEDDIRTPVDDMEAGCDSPPVRLETPEKIYSDFVKSLIANRTEGQIVNLRRERHTAIKLWDEDDQRRRGQLHISTSSPQSSSPLSSVSWTASDHTLDHSPGRVSSKIPYFGLDKNTSTSQTPILKYKSKLLETRDMLMMVTA